MYRSGSKCHYDGSQHPALALPCLVSNQSASVFWQWLAHGAWVSCCPAAVCSTTVIQTGNSCLWCTGNMVNLKRRNQVESVHLKLILNTSHLLIVLIVSSSLHCFQVIRAQCEHEPRTSGSGSSVRFVIFRHHQLNITVVFVCLFKLSSLHTLNYSLNQQQMTCFLLLTGYSLPVSKSGNQIILVSAF